MTIYQIKQRSFSHSPKFFSDQNLAFFHQRLEDFKVEAQEDGKYLISCPITDSFGEKMGTTKRLFNPNTNELECID